VVAPWRDAAESILERRSSQSFEPIEVYTFAMLVYFFILFPVTRGVDIFYQRVAHQGRS